jgi:hypothetical protein
VQCEKLEVFSSRRKLDLLDPASVCWSGPEKGRKRDETDRQISKQTDRQKYRQMDCQTGIETETELKNSCCHDLSRTW